MSSTPSPSTAAPPGGDAARRLTRGAGAGARRRSAALLGAATLLAVAAVTLDLLEPAGSAAVAARLAAAAAALVGGTTGVLLALGRRRREVPRRATALLLLAVGLALVFGSQALVYLITSVSAVPFAGWFETAGVTAGAPLWIVGMVLLTWPPGMTGRDVVLVAIDSLVGGLCLLVFWLLAVAPLMTQGAVGNEVARQIDVWAAYLAVLTVMVTAAGSRRSGALPVGQLVALQCSVLLYIAGGVTSAMVTPALSDGWMVNPALVVYVLALWVFRAFALRPAVDSDGPTQVRLRHLWATLLPFLPVPMVCVAILANRVLNGPLATPMVLLVLVAMISIIAANVALRFLIARDMGRLQATKLAAPLSGGVAEHWFEAVLGDSRDVITVVDRDGAIVYQTPSAAALTGRPAGALNGKHIADLFPGVSRREFGEILLRASHDEADRGPHEFVLVDASDRRHDTETRVTPLRTEGLDGFVLTTNDVSDRRRLRAALIDSSVRDRLTGLPNREGFLARVREVVPAALPGTVAIALLDLNAFRALNDTRGHSAGDQVLKVVAAALERLPTAVTAVGRTGPDEFALLVAAEPVGPDLGAAERALRESLTSVIIDEGRPIDVDFALGYAVKVDRAGAAGELLEHADLALAAARAGRSATPVAYRGEMRSALVSRLRAEADLRDALDSDRLLVHYQPIVSLPDQRLHSVEALARLRSPTGEIAGPAGFIELAEELGLIGRLGLQVLSIALRDSQVLSTALGRPIPVSVNVSPRQVDDLLPDVVSDALRSAGVPAERLVLELTESLLAERQESISAVLARIRGMGVAVALDDFGTGYSSLSYLAGLPVDLMKIDKSFVGRLGRSADSFALVRTLLQLAQNLGLATVAEGVETVEQADILRGMNCSRAQGYLFARPMPLADLLDLLTLGDGQLPVTPGRARAVDR